MDANSFDYPRTLAEYKQAEAYRQALIAKNEAPSPLGLAKVNQLVQNSVEAARWAGIVSMAQAKQEEEKSPHYWEVFEILKAEYAYELGSKPYLFEGRYYEVLVPPGK